MKHSINRRAMFTGAAALPFLALPMMPQAATVDVTADAKLFDLVRQWEEGKALETSFGAQHSDMERRAQEASPPVPAALLQAFDHNGAKITPHFPHGWCTDEIAAFAPNVKELLALQRDYEKALAVVWIEAEAGQDRFDEIVSANGLIIKQIGETPAHTLPGLLAKCRVSQVEGLFVNYCDYSDFSQGMVEDIERLALQIRVKA